MPRPKPVQGSMTEHPALKGALHSALATTRDEVCDTSAEHPDVPSPKA